MMNFCHRIRKAFTIFSPARKLRKSGTGGQSGGGVGGQGGAIDGDCGGSFGLLKLKEDVQTCGYRDVEVMYSLLRRKHEAEAEAARRDAATRRPEKREKKHRSIWKWFLWITNYSKS